MPRVRCYVIYGQGGAFTSGGMIKLADRINQLIGTTVTQHPWQPYTDIVANINAMKSYMPVALIGYSLGANATTWIASALRRPVELIVAYDPSKWSVVTPAPPNVKRGLLYHNNGWSILGHAVLTGPQMEVTEISQGHLSVDYNEMLHLKTLAAIQKLIDAK